MRKPLFALPLTAASFVVALGAGSAAAQIMPPSPASYQPSYYPPPSYHPQPYPAPVQPYPPPAYYLPPVQSSCCCPVAKRGFIPGLAVSPCRYGAVSPQYPQYPAYTPYPQYPSYPQYQPYPQPQSYPQYQAYPQYTAYPPAAVYPQPHLRMRVKVRTRAGRVAHKPPRRPSVYGPWGNR
jgi:hypothetical protein